MICTTTRKLAKQAAQRLIDAQIKNGLRCPECSKTKIESNGKREYRCVVCDHRWGFDTGERYGF